MNPGTTVRYIDRIWTVERIERHGGDLVLVLVEAGVQPDQPAHCVYAAPQLVEVVQ